ncbi:MAG: nucleotide exchange factor GrpE, partial [Pseudanabaenaceae cyanobacterium]
FKFDALIQEALKQDDAVWDEDSEECQKYIEQAKLWHSKTDALYTSVSTAISDCVNRIDECGDLMQEINKENLTLYKSLLDRHKSLELSKRMLERLREPIELLKKASLPLEQLLRLQKQELVDLLRSQTEEAEAKKILAKKVKETGDTRYKSIREWRDLAEKSQKQWLNFIEKKLLFAFDGISDGKPYAQHLVDELRPSYQTSTCQKKLDDWLQTYLDLENILLEALKNLDITPMSVEIGKPVDYNLHEPIATEPDPNLDHESVKEVTRNGYEYKLPDQEQPLILRSAQVIVVKNK